MNIKEVKNQKTRKISFNLKFDMSENGFRMQKIKKGFPTREIAEKNWPKFEKLCLEEFFSNKNKRTTLDELVEAHEAASVQGRVFDKVQIDTAWNRSVIIRKYMQESLGRPADEISGFDVRTALQKMLEEGKSRSRMKAFKGAVNGVYTWAIQSGVLKGVGQSPAFGLKIGREDKKKREVLTIDEIKVLLRNARKTEHPWYEVWAGALLTGMRSGELYALKWSDLDWEKGIVSVTKSFSSRIKGIKSTKTGMWRNIPINADLRRLLSELRLKAKGSEYVFPRLPRWQKGSQSMVLRTFCVGIGLKPITFHTLRACFATSLLRNGVPAVQVMKVGGWSELKTMQHYIRLSGVDVEGITDGLQILPENEVMGRLVPLYENKN